MGYDISTIRAWIRRAIRVSKSTRKPLSEVLDDINDAILGGGIQSGQIVVSSSEAGGSVSLAVIPGLTPLELAALNENAIAYCNQFSDPNAPNINGRRIRRMRVSFAKAKP